jgi:hypothetical protein
MPNQEWVEHVIHHQLAEDTQAQAMPTALIDRFPFAGRLLEAGFLRDRVFDPAGNNPEGGVPDHDPNRDPHKDDRDKPDYSAQLICRTYAGDQGARPLAPNMVFWESPDIWVEAPDGSDIPIANVVNQVHVHVWNLGMKPAYGVWVDLYWCDPSVGVNLAQSHHIGTVNNFMLNPNQHQVVSFDWTPQIVNNGHECLVAQVYDPAIDVVVAPFNPVQDRHVAQHNIATIRLPAGQKMSLNFFTANLSPMLAHSEIQVQALDVQTAQGLALALGREALPLASGAQAEIAAVRTRRARPTLNLDEFPVAAVFREALEPAPQRFVRGLQSGALAALSTGDMQKREYAAAATPEEKEMDIASPREGASPSLHQYELRPMQELRLTLAVALPDNARAGTYYAYRVIERNGERITGGITYLVEVSPPGKK